MFVKLFGKCQMVRDNVSESNRLAGVAVFHFQPIASRDTKRKFITLRGDPTCPLLQQVRAFLAAVRRRWKSYSIP